MGNDSTTFFVYDLNDPSANPRVDNFGANTFIRTSQLYGNKIYIFRLADAVVFDLFTETMSNPISIPSNGYRKNSILVGSNIYIPRSGANAALDIYSTESNSNIVLDGKFTVSADRDSSSYYHNNIYIPNNNSNIVYALNIIDKAVDSITLLSSSQKSACYIDKGILYMPQYNDRTIHRLRIASLWELVPDNYSIGKTYFSYDGSNDGIIMISGYKWFTDSDTVLDQTTVNELMIAANGTVNSQTTVGSWRVLWGWPGRGRFKMTLLDTDTQNWDTSVDLNKILTVDDIGVSNGVAGLNEKGIVHTSQLPIVYHSATLLDSAWIGTESPYTQTITIPDITVDTMGFLFLAHSASQTEAEAGYNALLRIASQSTDQITIIADGEKPDIDIPIGITMLG